MKLIRVFLMNEKGQALVIAAISMIVLLGFTAMVTDVGYLHLQKRNLQNAADSAALASAWELPNGNLQDKAVEYAANNDIHQGVTAQKLNSQEVKVTITNNYPRFIGKIFGSSEYEVYAEAIARTRVTWGGSGSGLQPFAPLPGNYTDERTCANGLSVQPLVDEEDFDELKPKVIGNVDMDYAGDLENRLDNFMSRVNIGANVGIITGAANQLGANFGFIDMRGNNQSSAGASLIAGWIYYGVPDFDVATEFHVTSNPGGINSVFTGFNWEDNQSPIEYMLTQNGGTFYVLLPHPSLNITSPHTPIRWGDYLIAEVFVEDDTKYGCGANSHYRLIAEIVDVFNPLSSVNHEELIGAGIKRINPFLIL